MIPTPHNYLRPKAPKHGRMKRKRKMPPTVAEKKHMDRVADLGCLVCPLVAELHHERKHNSPRDHRYVTPLCPSHHRLGKDSRHSLGREGFCEKHGIDLWAWAKEQWAISEEMFAWQK